MEKKKFSFWVPDDEEEQRSKSLPKKPQQEIHTESINVFNFKETGSKKYLLKINSMMNFGGFPMNSEVEIRWMLNLKGIFQDGYKFELITLDHTIAKSSDPGYLEIHKLVAQMHKSLNDLIFTTNKKGELILISNIDTIREKWKSVKAELLEYNRQNTSLQDLFKVQDGVFESKEGVEQMVKAMEFFEIYLGNIYGRKFPFETKKEIPNIFRTGNVVFNLSSSSQINSGNYYDISVRAVPNVLTESYLEKSFGNFPFVDIKKDIPIYKYGAKYRINAKDGFLEEAEINFSEYVNEKLGGNVQYILTRYE